MFVQSRYILNLVYEQVTVLKPALKHLRHRYSCSIAAISVLAGTLLLVEDSFLTLREEE